MILPVMLALLLQFCCPALGAIAWCAIPPANATGRPQPQSAARPAATGEVLTGLPHGRKLVLKDGSYQLVRSYEKKGDRVRYFSVEREAWEEIPDALVDWDATKKAGEADEKAAAALLEKTRIQEAAANAQTPIDVDASLLVAPGVFLPDGEGMFAIEGKSVKRLEQAGSVVKTDKKTALTQILSPIPIVPSKHNVELPGARATVRLTSTVPEFYLREPALGQDADSAVLRSSRQGPDGPDVTLVRAKIKGNKRLLESIRNLFGQQLSQEREEIAVQRWEVAPDIYRFTLSAPLPPGEYALAEILQDGLNLYVWDFGVDAAPAATPAPHKSK
ncbi:MAG TPA: hypothetical protein VFJ47_06160 [Terriglobales bacterium]|nr:hypothetical protein [Terriglobales bacterium]